MVSRLNQVTIEQFEELIASGQFEHNHQRVDLLYGELRFMSPAGPFHDDILTYLEDWSVRWAGTCGCVKRSEKGIEIPYLVSVPEPDIAWVKQGRYRKQRPTAQETRLIVEVSYSSLDSDRTEMKSIYAEAGIPEYWIVNCVDACIEVHRDPDGSDYRICITARVGETISPLVCPAAELSIAELFSED